ncbi:Formamidopyrimidine-DNA glycosylase [Sinomonas atrocyanea]|uniref:DNA-(apurinic or apyrimidinic site) lyase n=1 Tax=Sinomonas atrocyanea TaxID=37927 RepID=A0A127A2A1_9MICC|nr:DNA-formamidopyrimidine glycosylase family protein [Sinomonas atrocyanea]AMM33011.1 Formamidopyrimidine-DNA glycosylase [Sinomonas atrocyanea]GEB64300.1 formamidopyrimidine-DNA glycosylase [Sinomonas atrocyanea]GGG73607.1 formamidopyrimidine-DNA glycosylase [Sinomonas atrocyanea]
MPEGHSIHRLARQFGDVFVGERLAVSSPQGRFAPGAALLDGRVLQGASAHGKQLFLRFEGGMVLRVHLGLYGAWEFGGDATFRGASSIGAPRRVGERETADDAARQQGAAPPPPRGAVRARLVSEHGWADLRGASACVVETEDEARAVQARLGPDPLGGLTAGEPRASGDEDAAEFARRIARRRTPVARLLMDQEVVAGIGNVYRAELLFRARLDPFTPGTSVGRQRALSLWADAVAAMAEGVRHGRIVTTDPRLWPAGPRDLPAPEDAHYVYRRHGLPCRACGTAVTMAEEAGRKLYWCRVCQASDGARGAI